MTRIQAMSRQFAPRLAAAAILLPTLSFAQAPPRYTISTVVGTGAAGFAGDAGQAAAAQINNPIHAVLDSSGNLYIADQLNHRIRKVGTDGVISTIAGKDTSGYSSSDTTATSAAFNAPCGLALDKSNNLHIADSANHIVRKLTGTTIATVVGTATASYSGDNPLDTTTNLPSTSTLTGLAVNATVNLPTGIVFDSKGDMYIADTNNHRIRKVTTSTGKIETWAGNGTGAFKGDGGKATEAQIYHPVGLAIDSADNLYVADQMNHRIRKITPAGIISTVAGSGLPGYSGNAGPATSAKLRYPTGVAVDSAGRIFIADTSNSRIRVVLENGAIHNVAGVGRFGGEGDGGNAEDAELRFPTGVITGSNGKIYVIDTQNSRIRLLTPRAATATSGQLPLISEGSVVTAPEFGVSSTPAPGSWIEIYGDNLARDSRDVELSLLVGPYAPLTIEGTRVTIDNVPALISSVSPNRLRVQVPATVAAGVRELRVFTEAGGSEPYQLTVNPVEPGLEAPAALRVGDVQYASAVTSASKVSPETPAHPGETVTLFGNGFGAMSGDGSLVLPLRVFIGGVEAEVASASLVEDAPGIFQIRVTVPNVPEGGSLPLTFSLDGNQGRQSLFLAIAK